LKIIIIKKNVLNKSFFITRLVVNCCLNEIQKQNKIGEQY